MPPSFFRRSGFVLFLALAVTAGLYATRSYSDRISAAMTRVEPAAGTETERAAAVQQPLTGSFSLTDQDGRAVTEASYPGQFRLVFFGFTNCPDICPTGLRKIAQALELLGDDAEQVKPLFITVDPERDTPDVLKTYTEQFGPRLTGLTGTPAQIKAAQDAFKVYSSKQAMEGHDHQAGHYMMDHSAFIYLQEPDGHLVEFFGTDDTASDIAAAVKILLNNG